MGQFKKTTKNSTAIFGDYYKLNENCLGFLAAKVRKEGEGDKSKKVLRIKPTSVLFPSVGNEYVCDTITLTNNNGTEMMMVYSSESGYKTSAKQLFIDDLVRLVNLFK